MSLPIRRLTTGRVRGKRRTSGPLRYLPGGWADETLPVNAYAVEHPAGTCLFDTGQTARATQPGYHPWWHPYLRLARFELDEPDEVGAQVEPATVRWVVLSHLHTDHVGGIGAFTHAEVLVSRVEWDRAAGWRGRLRGYVPQHWPAGLHPTLVDLPAEHDVAGDGRLLMVPLPGHTPGHAGLIIDGETLLAGDAQSVLEGFAALRAHDGSRVLRRVVRLEAVSRVIVTTAVRHADSSRYSGYVRIVDLGTGDVVLTEPMPESDWRHVDPNPRGGTRGARGVSATADRLVIANSNTIFVFDRTWALETTLTHPLAGALHDILAEDDGVWVTSANADLLLKLGWDGAVLDSWCWRDDRALVRTLGFRSVPPFDATLDYRDPRVLRSGAHNTIHLNALARVPDGMLLSFGRVLPARTLLQRRWQARIGRAASRLGVERRRPAAPPDVPASTVGGSSHAVVQLHDDGAAELLFRILDTSVPNHNLVVDEDGGIVYADSNAGRLVACTTGPYVERTSVAIPGSPSFARGLARLEGSRYVVGSQRPLALHTVDLERGALTGTLELAGEANESVYAIAPLPNGFGDIPARLFASSRDLVAGAA